jgi:hypothetical protein
VVAQLCLVVVHQQRVGHHNQRLAGMQRLKNAARTCAQNAAAAADLNQSLEA